MPNDLQRHPSVQEGQVIEPVVRTKCPFYGFMGLPGAFVDQQGNACALTGEHSPCAMEMANQAPCWAACTRYNTAGNQQKVHQVLSAVNVFPREFAPYGDGSWTGINAKAWFRYVTGHDHPYRLPSPAAH